jgi:hypothetical protein
VRGRWLVLNEDYVVIQISMLFTKNWMKFHVLSAWTIHIMLFSYFAALMIRAADLTFVIQVIGIQIVWTDLKK